MHQTSKTSPGIVRRTLTVAIGCLGLAWGIFALPQGEAADEFAEMESRLLRSEIFSRTTMARTLDSQVSQNLSPCDTHSQRALLLMEMPLAEAALRSGAAKEFDRRVQSLETRATRSLGCAPRESFIWLVLFDLKVLHGQLDEQSFNLLAMSYETSPNEAWISIRRIIVATPLLLVAPELLRQKILHEFQDLISNGFSDQAARSYLAAPEPVRSVLLTQIEQLGLPRQKAFADALQRVRS